MNIIELQTLLQACMHACTHVDIICQRYLNSLLLTFFADGNHHHTLQKGVFAPSFFTENCVRFIKYRIWNGSLSERERERKKRRRERRKRKRAKKREEEERKGILPFGNGCGSGAH
jgi:hypothetical protein